MDIILLEREYGMLCDGNNNIRKHLRQPKNTNILVFTVLDIMIKYKMWFRKVLEFLKIVFTRTKLWFYKLEHSRLQYG